MWNKMKPVEENPDVKKQNPKERFEKLTCLNHALVFGFSKQCPSVLFLLTSQSSLGYSRHEVGPTSTSNRIRHSRGLLA